MDVSVRMHVCVLFAPRVRELLWSAFVSLLINPYSVVNYDFCRTVASCHWLCIKQFTVRGFCTLVHSLLCLYACEVLTLCILPHC